MAESLVELLDGDRDDAISFPDFLQVAGQLWCCSQYQAGHGADVVLLAACVQGDAPLCCPPALRPHAVAYAVLR